MLWFLMDHLSQIKMYVLIILIWQLLFLMLKTQNLKHQFSNRFPTNNEFVYCYLIKIKHILTNKNYFIYSYQVQANQSMLDIIIILVYLFVILKYSLKCFRWFQNKIGITETQNQKLQKTKENQQKKTTSSKIKASVELPQKPLIKNKQPIQKKLQRDIFVQNDIKDQDKKNQKRTPNNQLKISSMISQDGGNLLLNRLQTVSQKQSDDEKPVNQTKEQQKQVKPAILIQDESNHEFHKKEEKVSNGQKNNEIKSSQDFQKKYNQLLQQNELLKKEKLLFAAKLQKIINQANQNAKHAENIDYNQTINELKNAYQHKIAQIQNSYDKLQNQMAAHLSKRNQIQQIKDVICQKQRKSCEENFDSQNQQLKQKVQELKGQLQFCQNQLHQAIQSQNKLKEQNQQLQKNTNRQGHASITTVINHPEYIRVKEMLNRYQTGTKSQFKPRSFIRGQYTPKVARQDKVDSRISERRQFVGSKNISGLSQTQQIDNTSGLFPECDFLNQENKAFVLSEIKKIKKLNVKKTKQIYKLDKLHPTNPHDYIDNIPNIVLVIELTNGKVLAAFTQLSFSKDDTTLLEKGSLKSGSRMSGIGSSKAVIMDVSSKKAFANRAPQNSIIYDQNAIVWGKEELVIKNDEPTILYSQFGSQNGVYWDGIYTLQELLGSTKKSQRMNKYQIHRVYIS